MKAHLFFRSLIYFLVCFTISPLLTHAQTRSNLKGRVLTADGEPAVGVSVTLIELKQGSSTDENGDYEINNVPYGVYTIRVSALGLNAKSLDIEVVSPEMQIPLFTLTENASALREVIIDAVGTNKYTRKRSEFVSKMPLSNLENPQVYTSITKEVLKDQMVTNFNDALKNSSGLDKLWSSTGRSGDGAAFYTLRGFSTQPSLINGVGSLTNGDLDPANIEQIEVIKGPSGTLFGGALVNFGGLINVVTKRPLDSIGGEVSYTAGSFAQHRVAADVYSPINKSRNLLARINAAYHTQNSFQDAGFRRSTFIAPSLEYRPNERLTINLDAEIYHYKGTNALMVFPNRVRQLIATNPSELQFDFNKSYTTDDLTVRTPTTNFRGQIQYKLSDRWISNTHISYNRRKSNGYLQYVMYLDTDNPPMVANDTMLTRYVTNQDALSQAINIQQNFIGDFELAGFRNRLVVGLDFLRQVNENDNSPWVVFDRLNSSINDPNYGNINRELVDQRIAASTFPRANTWAATNIYSIYASDIINLTDRFIALLSLRADRFQNFGTQDLATDVTTGDYMQTAFSPKFGLIYQLVKDQVSVFANYMNGFRNVAPATQPFPDIPNTFKPQQANQFEGGVKLDVFANRLSFTASFYDISVSNITRTESIIRDDSTYNITVQNGTQLSRGFEFDLVARPIEGLNLIMGYSKNYSKITNADEFVNDRRPTSAGPAHLINAWASYTLTHGTLKGMGLGFGGNYASENIITNDARTGTFTLPAYTVLNASVFFDAKRFRVGLKADNFTDKIYFKGWTTVEPQMPRSFLANITYKF
ncbi:TonB-dependent receptor [Olivibacter sp. SDN3]|uniref:TonB-dependent receptor n=1 Tax=Olivibacter sp. SDN3 TaxID=2764720 RepID=UPI00165150B2|nr:TonB-dependent receptor [Olivibacter sp. SDN3]QNL48613.1 TonB-dependent receptor [Olivibacter sp. SDN3]